MTLCGTNVVPKWLNNVQLMGVHRRLTSTAPSLASSDAVTVGTLASKPELLARINALLAQVELNRLGSSVVCAVGAATVQWLIGNDVAARNVGELAVGSHRWVVLVLDKSTTWNDVYMALSATTDRLAVFGLADAESSMAAVLKRSAPRRLTNLTKELRYAFGLEKRPEEAAMSLKRRRSAVDAPPSPRPAASSSMAAVDDDDTTHSLWET